MIMIIIIVIIKMVNMGGDDVKELNLPSLLISPVSEYIDSKEMVCRKSDCRRESLGSRVSATCKVKVMSEIEVISDVCEATADVYEGSEL